MANPRWRRVAVLRKLSACQDAAAAHGRQIRFSRTALAWELEFSRSRMETIDLMCRLRLLEALARQAPQVLIEMGASPPQLRFLMAMRLSPTRTRRLWQRWGRLLAK